MPASVAASGLEPIAYSSRPMRELRMTVPTTSITTTAMSASTGMPRTVSRAELEEAVGHVGRR